MSDGKIRLGQSYIPEDDVTLPFTQRMVDDKTRDTLLGDPAVDVDPHQESSSLAKIYDLATLREEYLDVIVVLPTYVTFSLPPRLGGFTVVTEVTNADGETSVTCFGEALGSSINLSLSPRVEGSGSGAIMPDVQPTIYEPDTNNLLAKEVLLFVLEDSTVENILLVLTQKLVTSGTTFTVTVASPAIFTAAGHGFLTGQTITFSTTGALPTGLLINTLYYVTVLTSSTFRVATSPTSGTVTTSGTQFGVHTFYKAVRPWPIFKPVPHTLTITGESTTISANASVQQQVAISGSDVSLVWSEGTGISRQLGITTKTVRIPPTIHSDLTLDFSGSPSTSATVNTSASITMPEGENWPARSADTGTISQQITASLAPNIFGPTTPPDYPTSGLYLQALDTGAYRYGLNRVRAVVFDFATIYVAP